VVGGEWLEESGWRRVVGGEWSKELLENGIVARPFPRSALWISYLISYISNIKYGGCRILSE
jgi:hypothetical protein